MLFKREYFLGHPVDLIIPGELVLDWLQEVSVRITFPLVPVQK